MHGLPVPPEVRGHSLLPALNADVPVRQSAVFGIFGGPIGVTDGEWVLYHYPPDVFREGLFEYTLAPAHMTAPFSLDELRTAHLSPPFDFTKGVPLLSYAALKDAARVPNDGRQGFADLGTRLYNVLHDPRQRMPTTNADVSSRLYREVVRELRSHDTPAEVFDWYDLQVASTG